MNTIEMYAHTLIGRTLLKSFYKNYIDSLDLSNSRKILEFGCGTGCMTHYLLKKIDKNTSLACLDIDNKSINFLRKKFGYIENINYLDEDIRSIDFKSGSFDTIIIHYMFHDIDSRERPSIIDKFNSILEDKGHIYIREPIKISHGIPSEEIKRLFNRSGFVEKNSHMEKRFIGGEMFSALYEKI